jgi:FdhE protein
MKLRTFRVEVQFVVVIAPAHLTIFSANYIPIAGDGQYWVRSMPWRLRGGPAVTDNLAVSGTSWRKRIGRAEELTVQYPFAAELLDFYGHLARFQESLSLRLDRAPAGGFSDPLEADLLRDGSEPFLLMAEKYGPSRLADVARRLLSTEMHSGWFDLLNATWSATEHMPSEPQDFLARAFLQPLAERVRLHHPAPRGGAGNRLCPFCQRKPGAGVLRPQGDGALRSLLCSFCFAEWDFRRIACANCGEENNKKLPVYIASEFPHVRVECCDSCKTYSKSVDLTKSGHADPVVDEIASASLDLWAQERAYAKLHLNLLGL